MEDGRWQTADGRWQMAESSHRHLTAIWKPGLRSASFDRFAGKMAFRRRLQPKQRLDAFGSIFIRSPTAPGPAIFVGQKYDILPWLPGAEVIRENDGDISYASEILVLLSCSRYSYSRLYPKENLTYYRYLLHCLLYLCKSPISLT